ncbi:hypothetical protein AB0J82_19875 [Asanoa sp. NPDC049518]|uniref:hypothetical protein n=1 Tax=unclassified Asanoa TaxID=2685164 RepID=UPI00342C6247
MGAREPLGRPEGDTDPADTGADDDFAVEHEDTTVDEAIVDGDDRGESESPRGWAGLEERDHSGN